MGSDPWFAEDISNALLAANEGGNPSLEWVRVFLSHIEEGYRVGAVSAVVEAHKQGHRAALTTLALAFGLSPTILLDIPEKMC